MSNAAEVVSRFVDELPERRVREILTELLLATTVTLAPAKAKPAAAATPAARSSPQADKKLIERRKRYAANRSAKRAAERGRRKAPAGDKPSGIRVTAEALWRHAEKLTPGKPWRSVSRELSVTETDAKSCYAAMQLPDLEEIVMRRFLDLPPG
jgi:hypothetical protein